MEGGIWCRRGCGKNGVVGLKRESQKKRKRGIDERSNFGKGPRDGITRIVALYVSLRFMMRNFTCLIKFRYMISSLVNSKKSNFVRHTLTSNINLKIPVPLIIKNYMSRM